MAPVATRNALGFDQLLRRDAKLRLWVAAAGAEHELLDEAVEQVLEAAGVKLSVDNVPFVFRVHLSLSAELDTEVLAGVRRRSIQRLSERKWNEGGERVRGTLES